MEYYERTLLNHILGAAPGGAAGRLRHVPGPGGPGPLHALSGDGSWAEPVVSVLAEGAHWSDQIDAAIALAGFAPTPRLVDALAQAVEDRHYLVRYHAANTCSGTPAAAAPSPTARLSSR